MKNIVFMYHDDDKRWKDDLSMHLAGLRREGRIRIIELADPLNMPELHIILALISPSLLGSDTLVNGVNFAIAQQLRQPYEQRIIPILCRKVDIAEDLPRLGKIQSLPRGEPPKPLEAWKSKDEVLAMITGEIRQIVRDLER
jgi:hypothetical protein